MVNVSVLSRDEIEKVDLNFVPVISIVGIGTRSVKLNNPLRVLTLVFDDVIAESTPEGSPNIIFSKSQAEDILDFIKNLPEADELNVIIHCEGGISRSAGVARGLEICGLAKWSNFDRTYWDIEEGWRSAFHPNPTVVNTIVHTFNDQQEEDGRWRTASAKV